MHMAICLPMLPLWCSGIAMLGNGLIEIYFLLKDLLCFAKLCKIAQHSVPKQ